MRDCAYTHARTHTHEHTHARTHSDTRTYTQTDSHTHTHRHTHTRAHNHKDTHTRTRAHANARTHTHAGTHTHPRTHKHTHTNEHEHAPHLRLHNSLRGALAKATQTHHGCFIPILRVSYADVTEYGARPEFRLATDPCQRVFRVLYVELLHLVYVLDS